MTPLQLKMLNAIARSEYQPGNGAKPTSFDDTGEVWSQYIINTPEEKGVAASLINAGFIECQNGDRKADNTVALTRAGFDAWKANIGP